MDVCGGIPLRRVPAPYVRYSHLAKTTEEEFGAGVHAVPATQGGFKDAGRDADPDKFEVSDKLMFRNARVWIFRYNDTSSKTAKVSSNTKAEAGQYVPLKLLGDATKIERYRIKLQNETLCNTPEAEERKQWFVCFVEAEVSNHNFQTYLRNLRLDHARLSFPTVIGEQVAAKTARLEKQSQVELVFNDAKQRYVSSTETAIAAAKDERQKLSAAKQRGDHGISIGMNIDRLTKLREWLVNLSVESRYTRVDNIDGHKSYYHEFSSKETPDFWEERWNKNAAYSFYHAFRKDICLSDCFDSSFMGEYMRITFTVSCHNTEQFVLGPRRENERVARCLDDWLRQYLKFHEWRNQPYIQYRELAREFLQGREEAKKGIELVLVPDSYNASPRRVKGGAMPRQILDFDT